MTKRIAIFPGSFDPITKGHEDIVKRALPLFDEIIIAIGINPSKKYFFPEEKRKDWIEKIFKNESKVKVETYKGLTVDFCKQKNAAYILRGLRNSSDFEFESAIAQMNKAMENDIETIFIVTSPGYSAISSTIVRNIIENKGDVSQFVPAGVDCK